MNIAGGFLIHFKCRVSISKQNFLVLNGNHIFFNGNTVITFIIDFNVVGTQIDTECIVCQNDNPFLM